MGQILCSAWTHSRRWEFDISVCFIPLANKTLGDFQKHPIQLDIYWLPDWLVFEGRSRVGELRDAEASGLRFGWGHWDRRRHGRHTTRITSSWHSSGTPPMPPDNLHLSPPNWATRSQAVTKYGRGTRMQPQEAQKITKSIPYIIAVA